MARLARLCVPGYPHHIIQRGNNRQPICITQADYQHLLVVVREAAARYRVGLHAWVLLPDEFQLILTPPDAQALPLMMQDLGRRHVRHFNATHLRSGTLWEGRYRSTVLDPDDSLLAAMACLDRQPLLRGLAPQPEDYPWSSCASYAGLRSESQLTMPPQIWALGNTPFAREDAYRRLLDDMDVQQRCGQLQQAARQGWVQGSEAFVRTLQQLTGRRLEKKSPGRPRKLPPEPDE